MRGCDGDLLGTDAKLSRFSGSGLCFFRVVLDHRSCRRLAYGLCDAARFCRLAGEIALAGGPPCGALRVGRNRGSAAGRSAVLAKKPDYANAAIRPTRRSAHDFGLVTRDPERVGP